MNDATHPDDSDALLAGEAAAFEPDARYGTSAPIGAHIVNWRTLGDGEARAAWTYLRSWVEWFIIRYRVPESTIPGCWWKHGHLVEELSALHIAHTAAFDSSDAGFGPIGWHERLAVALPRLTRAYSGGCSNGHRDVTPRSSAAEIDEPEWDAWTTRAHAHGDTGVSHKRKEAV
ncbi:hypothetical protein ACLQ2Q_15505 [Microbacterium sp. DT81.1]|uniref:hypothetical protein n=1 Tax=Microbacterium sp. DT81.1 TaxID=3393413 RepID=UPI003CEF5B90